MGEALHLIVYCLTFHSEIFRSKIRSITVADEGLQNLALDSPPIAQEQEGVFIVPCILQSHSKDCSI